MRQRERYGDGMAVDVGEVSPPSGGMSKRTLLIGAVVIGGAAGLFILISRHAQGESGVPSEDQAQTSAPKAGALDLAYQNLATQLLGFRGDVSVANANLASGQQDLLSAFGNESANRARQDAILANQVGNIGNAAASRQRETMSALWNLWTSQHNPSLTWADLYALNPYVDHPVADSTDPNKKGFGTTPETKTTNQGAGGANAFDVSEAQHDAGFGDGNEGLRRLSAGPVRVISRGASAWRNAG